MESTNKRIPPRDDPSFVGDNLRPAMRRAGSVWQTGFRSELTGDWKEVDCEYSNRGHAVSRYRGLLRSHPSED